LAGEISLSSTKAEYTGLSYALREAIPLMELLCEIQQQGMPVTDNHAKVYCKVFEDNSGTLEMVKVFKFRPRAKHLNVELHHFCSYIKSGQISNHAISTTEQLADYLTKPVNATTLQYLRKLVMGW
jgi:hypothetical protein